MEENVLPILKGAVSMWPMGLPPVRLELEEGGGRPWWLEELHPGTLLADALPGANEKTKVVIKIGRRGSGPPAREPVFTEKERKELMMAAYRKKEEAKKLAFEDLTSDLTSYESPWASSSSLKRSSHGLSQDIS